MSIGNIKVAVELAKLLKLLHKNLEAHRKVHQEAVEGWEHEVVNACGLIIALVEEGRLKDLDLIFKHSQRPKSHTKEYELVITMLEHHTGTDVELDQQDFDRYVRDNWEWKEEWAMSNTRYSLSNRRRR